MKKIFLFLSLFSLLSFFNSHAQCAAKIYNDTAYQVLMLEYETTSGKKFTIRIDEKESRTLSPAELKDLNTAKKIVLHKYYPHRNGGEKRKLGNIDPVRFRLPGVYSFWHCTIPGDICISAQTEKDGKLVQMSHATW